MFLLFDALIIWSLALFIFETLSWAENVEVESLPKEPPPIDLEASLKFSSNYWAFYLLIDVLGLDFEGAK